jgi:hypothetical protein
MERRELDGVEHRVEIGDLGPSRLTDGGRKAMLSGNAASA